MGAGVVAVLQGPSIDWYSLSPYLVLLGVAVLVLVVSALTPVWPRHLASLITAATAVSVGSLAVALWHKVDREGPLTLIGNAIHLDKLALWTMLVIAVALLLATLISDDYIVREGLEPAETYSLFMLAAIGAITMAAANDLIVLFLGLETMSLALYVLVASHRRRSGGLEGGLKYFILGGFSSAFFLYGVALVYGATGSTNLDLVVNAFNSLVDLDRSNDTIVLAGVALMLVGLGFKVAAVPFHFWTPDVYQGAPTPVTGFMASAGKAAAFAAMLRVLIVGLGHFSTDYLPVLWVMALLTLLGGAVMGVVQQDVKRMLAFSSVSHAGFMLVGVVAAAHQPGSLGNDGVRSVLVYTMVYAVLALGTFAAVTAVARIGDSATDLGAFRGLGRHQPVFALGVTVLLLAQAGVPLTSGFVAKFGVIQVAVQEHSYVLAVLAMVSAVIAAYLYLRIMISMWVADEEPGDAARGAVHVPRLLGLALAASVAFTLVVGFFPDPLLGIAP